MLGTKPLFFRMGGSIPAVSCTSCVLACVQCLPYSISPVADAAVILLLMATAQLAMLPYTFKRRRLQPCTRL